jgi:hypothetical protein
VSVLEKIKDWFRREGDAVEELAEGSVRDPDRESSTNAQVEGAADEPWPGNE